MNKKLKLNLIKEAQERLIANPQNWAHEITHHFRVLELAKRIVKKEKLDLDNDILEVICMWHDVAIKENNSVERENVKTAKYLSEKFEGETRKLIHDSILNHEFGSKPNYLEGQVLQDADKLEILSVDRLNLDIEAKEAGFENAGISPDIVKTILEDWIPVMPERYHFEYSKQLHKKRLEKIVPVMEQYLKEHK